MAAPEPTADSHCHIDMDAFDEDRAEVLDRARVISPGVFDFADQIVVAWVFGFAFYQTGEQRCSFLEPARIACRSWQPSKLIGYQMCTRFSGAMYMSSSSLISNAS